MTRRIFPTSRFALASLFGVLAAGAALVPGQVPEAFAQEDASCLSNDPADWPAPSKPYFMLAIDTSGSMVSTVTSANSCGYSPNNRNSHSRCALRNTVNAFAGQVNFGLSTFAVAQESCEACTCDSTGIDAHCYDTCSYFCSDDEVNSRGGGTECYGCGPIFGGAETAAGAQIVVEMQQDNFWETPPDTANATDILGWVDNACDDERETFAIGLTPLNGMLRDMKRYFQGTYENYLTGETLPTPLEASDLAGTGVNGSTACRSVNVILQTDGDETCDTHADAVAAAADLYQNGVTVGGKTFKIRVFVINFEGASATNANEIAAAGGTGTAYVASDETTLATALSTIISSSVSPETCDNIDNNCNGCTDEGYRHYCNTNPVCCGGDRAACQASYEASITAQDPDGDLTLLPCTTVAQGLVPSTWLCDNPGETCDDADNNCEENPPTASVADEGVLKCGNPSRCPSTEVCNGIDDDCDGQTDEAVCGACVPAPETCNGCDDDCDGNIDEGVAPSVCGTTGACAGTRTCTPGATGVTPGTCQGVPTFGACSAQGVAETCNGVDDDCDGQIDDGVPPRACVPNGTDPALVYQDTFPASQCVRGQQACTGTAAGYGTCIGFQGPTPEVCDGIDNDCDGVVDDNPSGINQPCGLNAPPVCNPGVTECAAGGFLECSSDDVGGPESCNGIDDDCDGEIDDAPFTDAPAQGQSGCWDLPPGDCGSPCTHDDFSWCAPAGATCNGNGTLEAPCGIGTLTCDDGSWTCSNAVLPGTEVCDGLDNDCDGEEDEGSFPEEGEVCGDPDAPCQTGLTECMDGFIDCVGDIPPSAEICDGIDNDCDGSIDEGLIEGTGTCIPEYDEDDYPGERLFPAGPCQLGTLVCDGKGGTRCDGGSGPEPEICDGIDNDCDGVADESEGDPPDSVDGTENPDDPDQHIGDPCGISEGECAEGALACLNGRFECLGGQPPQVESCDCEDNDCDGTSDNQNPDNDPPLCSAGKDCVKSGGQCQCAEPCSSGEFPCPAGQTCETVTNSETGEPLGQYCVATFCPGGCEDQTFEDADGVVRCAPAGTVLEDCRTVPECVCKGQNGCVNPCFGVTCEGSLTCARFGEQAGTCVPDNCFNAGCQGCDVFCGADGTCISNPCADNDCEADEACFPDEDGAGFTCKKTCAGVECDDGAVCRGGECVADCTPTCGDDQVCDFSQNPANCIDNQCGEDACPNGGCCDPLTGECGACPCDGVTCPGEAICIDDECVDPDEGTSTSTGTGGGSGTNASSGTGEGAGATGATGATGANGATGAGGGSSSGGVFGLATGGGGCQCEVGVGSDRGGASRFAAVAAAFLLLAARRRRARREGRPTEAVASAKEVSR
jgi:hypothetical protein